MREVVDYPLRVEASCQVTEEDGGQERDMAREGGKGDEDEGGKDNGGDKVSNETKKRGVDPKANP